MGYSFNVISNSVNVFSHGLDVYACLTLPKSVRIRIFSGPSSPAFRLNTERYLSLEKNSEKNSEYGHFSCSIIFTGGILIQTGKYTTRQ